MDGVLLLHTTGGAEYATSFCIVLVVSLDLVITYMCLIRQYVIANTCSQCSRFCIFRDAIQGYTEYIDASAPSQTSKTHLANNTTWQLFSSYFFLTGYTNTPLFLTFIFDIISSCNLFLHQYKLRPNKYCEYCQETKENIEHLFNVTMSTNIAKIV